MLKHFLGLTRVLISIVPYILDKMDSSTRIKNSESLFEIQILVDQIAEGAKSLIDLAGSRDAIDLLNMPKEELEEKYNLSQVYIGLQLERMKRIHTLLEESDVLSIELPDVKKKLDDLIGSKEGGLYSIGAAMQFNLMFCFSIEKDDDEIDWVKTNEKHKEFIKYVIDGNDGDSSFDIVKHKELVTQIENTTKEFSSAIKEYLKPAERLRCRQKAKERAEIFNYRK